MLKLTQINIFPVKSLDGYSPTSAVVEQRGLRYDRRWLITEPDGTFMTQRTNGRMALLRAVVENNVLRIEEKANPSNCFKWDIGPQIGKKRIPQSEAAEAFHGYEFEPMDWRTVQVWDDTIQATHVSAEADAFLSDFLGKKCQLVAMPDESRRNVDSKYVTSHDIVSFADAYPYLIIGEATMQDLNERLDVPLSIRRFRTNFIFSGGQPFEEDDFKDFSIGDIPFKAVKLCARCVLITRDPDTGEKGREPLATLQTYRERGTKILFGQNVILNNRSWEWHFDPEVRVGDTIMRLEIGDFK